MDNGSASHGADRSGECRRGPMVATTTFDTLASSRLLVIRGGGNDGGQGEPLPSERSGDQDEENRRRSACPQAGCRLDQGLYMPGPSGTRQKRSPGMSVCAACY